MENQPLFTIITVVYNDAENLERTIKSLTSQQCKDYEYLILDGGSTDGTLEVIRKYEKEITYWKSEKDKGIYDAMNKGIVAAKGKYLHFLNAGDTYSGADLLQTVSEKVRNSAFAEVFYGKTIYQGEGSYHIKGSRVSYQDVYFKIPFCHQSMFFRRSLFQENGLYDTTYRYAADYAWMCKYLKSRKSLQSIEFIDKPISVYLDGGASFVNMEKVIEERKRIARNYFPSIPYYAFLLLSPILYVKTLLLKVMVRFQVLSYYRRAKHQLNVSFHSNQS